MDAANLPSDKFKKILVYHSDLTFFFMYLGAYGEAQKQASKKMEIYEQQIAN